MGLVQINRDILVEKGERRTWERMVEKMVGIKKANKIR